MAVWRCWSGFETWTHGQTDGDTITIRQAHEPTRGRGSRGGGTHRRVLRRSGGGGGEEVAKATDAETGEESKPKPKAKEKNAGTEEKDGEETAEEDESEEVTSEDEEQEDGEDEEGEEEEEARDPDKVQWLSANGWRRETSRNGQEV
jgi:hypothetical protein